MASGAQSLTEKEKQALRLLVSGHDAKSMARHLGLSVHTVNERLRDARRKLGTSSSREAARVLRDEERGTPDFLGDTVFGDAAPPRLEQPLKHAESPVAFRRAGMLIGGFAMTIALALYALASLSSASGIAATAPAASAAETAAVDSARKWLALVDAKNWQSSYAATGSAFRKLNSYERWSTSAQSAHGNLGAALSRELVSVDYSPAPPNGVWTIRFRSSFASRKDVIETIALAYEDPDWRVVGLTLD